MCVYHIHTYICMCIYIYIYIYIYALPYVFIKRDKLGPTFRAYKLGKNPGHHSLFLCAEFGEAEDWAQEWLRSPQ